MIENLTEPQLIYGGCLHFFEGKESTFGYLPPSFELDKLTCFDYIVQPSTFWSRSLWEIVGELNELYNYALDWEWFIRASKICKFVPMQDYLSIYKIHDSHKSSTEYQKRAEEIIKLIENYAIEEWIAIYKDVYKRRKYLKPTYKYLNKLKLCRLRRLLIHYLQYKYSYIQVDMAFSTLCFNYING